ncbi:PilZ domain-containing protein [Nannocystis pusilla]|uniref:PilZ domain-containing protein n=1 Tax=Nannocystis pusilla TaxID=889268 RepID=A0ABS7U197_9BACT|nr:PilZ domain-containing protein [Nannocystis pusilla]
MTDARFHPRLRIHAHADIIGSEVVLARALDDLSLGGCKFGGPAWEEAGQQVALVLSFPALSASLPLSGTVVRGGDSDMAIRFVHITDEQKSALRKHILDSQEAAGA